MCITNLPDVDFGGDRRRSRYLRHRKKFTVASLQRNAFADALFLSGIAELLVNHHNG